MNRTVNPATDHTVYYRKIAYVSNNSGHVLIKGILGGHTHSQGNATVDVKFSARDGFTALGMCMGTLGNSNILVKDNTGDTRKDIYLVTGVYSYVNLQVYAIGGEVFGTNENAPTSTAPSGTTTHDLKENFTTFRVDDDGNVGIGVTNPGTKLDVNGSLQSYSGRHVKTVPVRHNTYNDISGTGGGLRLGLMVPGQAAGYSGSYCAFSWFGTSSIHNFSADRWATPTRIRMCFKWGFVAGYIAYATFKIYETYYGGSDQLKATITSYNGSLSRGFTTVWGPDMTMQYGDVPGIMIVCDSNTGTTGATIRITDIWFEYVYI
jgi:hypothetical protein